MWNLVDAYKSRSSCHTVWNSCALNIDENSTSSKAMTSNDRQQSALFSWTPGPYPHHRINSSPENGEEFLTEERKRHQRASNWRRNQRSTDPWMNMWIVDAETLWTWMNGSSLGPNGSWYRIYIWEQLTRRTGRWRAGARGWFSSRANLPWTLIIA